LIKPFEREKIDPELAVQYGLLDKLVQNYCELLKLQNVVKKLDVHKSLFHKDKRFVLNFVKFDVEKFKKMYKMLDYVDEKIKNDYRHDLLRDVHTIESSLLQR
jgi:transcription-repair coupling factor (superfamily II helicase)